MRNLIAVSAAFAAVALSIGASPAAVAQTWVETHPVLIDAASHVQSKNVRAGDRPEGMLTPYREARLRPDVEPKPDDGANADKGSLDHPANATGESRRHE